MPVVDVPLDSAPSVPLVPCAPHPPARHRLGPWVALAAASGGFAAAMYAGRPAWPAMALAGCAALVVTFLRPRTAFVAVLLLVPLEAAGRVVPSLPAFTWAKIALVGCLAGLLARALVTRERLRLPPRIALAAAVVYVSVAASFAGGYGVDGETVKAIAGFASQVTLVAVAYLLLRSRAEISRAALAVSIASVPVLAVSVVEIATGRDVFPVYRSVEPLYASDIPGLFRITSTFSDPNTLGRYLLFALLWTAGALALPLLRRYRPLLLALLAVQAYCLLNTFSRAAFAVALAVLAPYASIALVRRFRARGVAVVLAVALAGTWAFKDLALVVLSRFEDPTVGGRIVILRAGFPVLARSPLLGYGREHVAQALGTVLGWPTDPHNLYMELLLSVGVVGALLAVAWAAPLLAGLAAAARRGMPEAVLVLMPLVAVCVFGLSLHGVDANEMWIPFAFASPVLRLADARREGGA